MKPIFLSAVLAGASIALGGTVFLSVENTVIGSLFFTIGLFVVCTRGLHLFTGKVCYLFDNDASYAKALPVIWLGNLVGTVLVAAAEQLTRLAALELAVRRFDAGDFGLRGVRGRELGRCTVGVVGTGRIGAWVVHLLKPFGCRVLANDVRENPEVQGLAEYVSREELFRQSDIITFHTPAVPDTFHLVNRDTLASMKPGVILINMSRGTVVDTEALIEALESGRVGAAALDVLENETAIYYRDFKGRPVPHREMNTLASMPNVLLTPHTAFFTREAVADMVEYSLQSLALAAQGKEDPRRVN